jgi:hypothetical protein
MEDIKLTDIFSHIEVEPLPTLTKNQKKRQRKMNAKGNCLSAIMMPDDLQHATLSFTMKMTTNI